MSMSYTLSGNPTRAKSSQRYYLNGAGDTVFSLTFVIVRHLSSTIEASEQAFFQQGMGILILLPLVIQRGLTSLTRHQIGLTTILKFAGNAKMSLLFLSMTIVHLGEAVTCQMAFGISNLLS